MQHYLNPPQSEWDSLTERPTASYDSLEPLVSTVFDAIKTDGDQSLIKYTAEFDGIQLPDFKVSEEELRKAGVIFKSETKFKDIFANLVTVDDEKRFITGQNQNAGHEISQKIMEILENE